MKNLIKYLILSIFLLIGTTPFYSCSKKTGCPINENAHVMPGKNGKYKKSKSKSGLFPKKRGGK